MASFQSYTVEEIAHMEPVDLITHIPEFSFNKYMELVELLSDNGNADCDRCVYRKKSGGNVLGDIFCSTGIMKMNNPICILTQKNVSNLKRKEGLNAARIPDFGDKAKSPPLHKKKFTGARIFPGGLQHAMFVTVTASQLVICQKELSLNE